MVVGKRRLIHPGEDAIARWIRGQTKFEVLVSPYTGEPEWWWMTLSELEDNARRAIEEEERLAFTIPMVTGKEPELSPDDVLKLARKIRRKRW